MRCAKSILLVFFFLSLLSLPAFSLEPQSSAQEARAAIVNMRADLQLLNISIANYEKKISELRILISQSQDDLTAQRESLTNSEKKLSELKTQYDALNLIYQSLSARYKQSTKIIKYGGITAAAIILTEGIVIALK